MLITWSGFLGTRDTHGLSSLQEVLIPEMKWRKACSAPASLSLPDSISCISQIPTDSTDSCFPSRKPPGSGEFRILSVATAFRGLTLSLLCKGPSVGRQTSERCFSLSKSIWKNPRAQAASSHEGRGSCPILAGAPRAPGSCLATLPLQRPSVRKMHWRKSPARTRN